MEDNEILVLIFFNHPPRERGKCFFIFDKFREFFAKMSIADAIETSGLNWNNLLLMPFTRKHCL